MIGVECYEKSDAGVGTLWLTPELPSAGFVYWRGEYFNNTGLLGGPALVRDGGGRPVGALLYEDRGAQWGRGGGQRVADCQTAWCG